MSVTWDRSVQSCNPDLPNPVEFGWALEEKQLAAKMTDELPAPEATIELSVCSCSKTKCVSGRCKCHKNNLKCSDMCKCQNCENTVEFVSCTEINPDD